MIKKLSKKNILPVALSAFLFSSCSTPVEKLNSEAVSQVTVLDHVTLTELDKLKKIGSGTCEIGANARTQVSNKVACENYLRNEAAKREANYIVFTSYTKAGLITANVSADYYKKK